MTIRVLVADDHALFRAGLRSLIATFPGFEVVSEAADGRDAVRLARQLEPDLVLMDLSMPGLNGLDATARIAREGGSTRVIAVSMHTAENYVLEALRAGAMAYVVKDAAADELEQAMRSVARGEHYLSPAVSRHVLADYLRLSQSGQPAGRASADGLTQRQREILQLIAEGSSTRDIAQRLSISVKTVETHRAELMRRLDIHDVAGLTRYAIRIGLVRPE